MNNKLEYAPVLDLFHLPDEILNIYRSELITDDEECIYTLEMYKFVMRDVLIQTLNDNQFTEIPFRELNDYQTAPEFADIEQKYGVLVVKDTETSVCVYLPGLLNTEHNLLELDLNWYSITYARLTPFNFRQLTIQDFRPKYNALTLFKRILLEAISMGATDLHFDTIHTAEGVKYPISCRIDTEIVPIDLFELDEHLNREIIGKLVESKTHTTSIDLGNPSGITAASSDIFGTGGLELRISTGKCIDGYHCVIRIQKQETFTFTLDKLGFYPEVLSDLEKITKKLSGATIITGAVRTGKNTTAFALANEMIKRPIKLVSYEYPVEVLMPMTQIDYMGDEDILLNAIRLAKKQDVNIAFLNEIPNKEVAFAVQDLINSSIHVITTMHLDRLWLLPYRLKEYYGNSYKDVISQINGVFNQKMFGVCCPHCMKEIIVEDIEDTRKKELLLKADMHTVSVSVGCDQCNYTGKIPGRNQPYVEHLLFSLDLVDQLLQCNEPYEMEIVLRKELFKKEQNIEHYMLRGIADKKLSLDALDAVIWG